MNKRDTETVTTQVRIPKELYSYIENESNRLGIAKNSILISLLDKGIKKEKAEVTV